MMATRQRVAIQEILPREAMGNFAASHSTSEETSIGVFGEKRVVYGELGG